ncbi:MAG TPA: GNAT family N-acetyltransferase [Jatrophihabitans sp.]|nr:GNAT family N-acetyltransferase [Jatrophihabitans sp.]
MTAAGPVPYHEPGRGFASVWLLGAVLVAGFLIDLGFGGARAHLLGWIVAAVLVLGVDLIVIASARATKSLTVDDVEVRIGDEAIMRADIAGVTPGMDDPELPVLGWPTGMPRGTEAVTVRLTDDRRALVPTRRPDRLLAALGAQSASPAREFEIRPARAEELAELVEIDQRAESVFRVAGYRLPEIELSVDDLAAAAAVFVTGSPPVGFAQLDEVDGTAHLRELAVLPKAMRAGHGSRLLAHACAWAREQGYPAMTLTTYRDVAWNAPFYAKRGFVELADPPPALAAIRARERDLGLDDVGARIVMRRELGDAPPGA